jgi:uncharacterized cupin superfamily protein
MRKHRPIRTADIPWEELDDVPRFKTRYRHLTRAALGEDYRIGVAIEELPPGMRSAPAHYHIFEEEHVFILEGSLTARIGAEAFAMTAGDYVCFPAGHRAAHNLVNEGDHTCRYVVVGEKNPDEIVVFPDSNKVLVRALDRVILDLAARRDYWDGEETGLPLGAQPAPPSASSSEPAKPFPPIASDDVAWEETRIDRRFGGRAKHLTYAAIGAKYRVGMLIEAPGPGQRLAPLHYHMREEEHALILEGEVTLLLGDERLSMQPGDYVCFPAGEKTGHSFLNSGNGSCRYLMIGARDAADVCVYPQSDKMAVTALDEADSVFDLTARRRYWDGEAEG